MRMTDRIHVAPSVVAATLADLQHVGRDGCEKVVLWLGRRSDSGIRVAESFSPPQRSGADFFEIPPEGMAALFRRIRSTGMMVAAQVHTHPQLAFHSAADDRWAIVRHEGALSLVLPWFGLRSTLTSFAADVAVFRLSKQGVWCCVSGMGYAEVEE